MQRGSSAVESAADGDYVSRDHAVHLYDLVLDRKQRPDRNAAGILYRHR
jgi:hypothetical protein